MTLPAQQAQVFLAMMACGGMLGVVWDAVGILRHLWRPGKLAAALLDLSYGPLCALGVIVAALYLQTEVMRWYVLLAVGLGGGVYFALPGRFVRRIAAWTEKRRKKRLPENTI